MMIIIENVHNIVTIALLMFLEIEDTEITIE